MGVFQIKNEQNGRILIKGSTDIHAKWNRHQAELRFGSHRNKELQKDWKNTSSENFSFSILTVLEYKTEEKVNYREEVKVLKEMILEELNLIASVQY